MNAQHLLRKSNSLAGAIWAMVARPMRLADLYGQLGCPRDRIDYVVSGLIHAGRVVRVGTMVRRADPVCRGCVSCGRRYPVAELVSDGRCLACVSEALVAEHEAESASGYRVCVRCGDSKPMAMYRRYVVNRSHERVCLACVARERRRRRVAA